MLNGIFDTHAHMDDPCFIDRLDEDEDVQQVYHNWDE